jgi:hypothetical protein
MKSAMKTTADLASSAVGEFISPTSSALTVEFKVGAYHYTIPRHALKPETIKDTFFERCLSDEWMPEDGIIRIEREGSIFRFVLFFLEFGFLPTDKYVQCVLNETTLQNLVIEADFYSMPLLTIECVKILHCSSALRHFYVDNGSILTTASMPQQLPRLSWECIYHSEDKDHLVNTLESFFMPFCVSGEVDWYKMRVWAWDQQHQQEIKRKNPHPLFKSSTIGPDGELNLPELIEAAKPSCFGKGPETVFDLEVRNSLEIAADELNQELLNRLVGNNCFNLEELSTSMRFDIKPYKLVIYQEGGHFGEHVDTVRGEGHVGTLVYFCNSEFTGGELEVRSRGIVRSFNKPNSWVALFGDCKHSVLPVTSGIVI